MKEPEQLNEWVTLYEGDCLEVMKSLPENSIGSIVTDPPYGLGKEPDALAMLRDWFTDGHHDVKGKGFMGKEWDAFVPQPTTWKECLRVLKPGGHLLSFGGTRTYDLVALGLRIAGFEIRDCVAWVYGSGFPKSADVSKMLDKHEKKQWTDVSKAIDNTVQSVIMEAWEEYSKTASCAGLSFTKSGTETGTNTGKSGSVPASVLLQANPENSDAVALVAELSLTEARLTNGANFNSVQSPAENSTTELRSLAIGVENLPARPVVTLCMPDFSALQSAWGGQGESTADKLKAVEALKTWLGSKQSSEQEATSALCAALTADLKLITLSRSKTFQNFDTTRQMACASAISATITESTAESLISFTVDTLRSKAIDKADGAERARYNRPAFGGTFSDDAGTTYGTAISNTPATDAAREWSGWGTALKPAYEPCAVCRKPIDGTVAENVLKWGTGAVNVDGCRVATEDKLGGGMVSKGRPKSSEGWDRPWMHDEEVTSRKKIESALKVAQAELLGRWPANLIHDGCEEVVSLFPQGKSPSGVQKPGVGALGLMNDDEWKPKRREFIGAGDSGSAARFFYCAKASKSERGKANNHPTVKPLALMQYLIRLVTHKSQTVLDPYGGSGTTAIAAMREGVKCIVIERDPAYCQIIRDRVRAESRNPVSKSTETKPTVHKEEKATLPTLFDGITV